MSSGEGNTHTSKKIYPVFYYNYRKFFIHFIIAWYDKYLRKNESEIKALNEWINIQL